jgi:hypothetical protein
MQLFMPARDQSTLSHDEPFKLFVGNVPKVYSEMQLLPYFEGIGEVLMLA